MQTDDLIKHTHRWVLGYCVEWNYHAKQFSDINAVAFLDFVARTHSVVYRYLRGRLTLDGSCSDLECTLAVEAKHVFGLHLD